MANLASSDLLRVRVFGTGILAWSHGCHRWNIHISVYIYICVYVSLFEGVFLPPLWQTRRSLSNQSIASLHVYIYTYTRIYMYTYTDTVIYIYMCIYIYTRIHVYVYVYVGVYIYIYIDG